MTYHDHLLKLAVVVYRLGEDDVDALLASFARDQIRDGHRLGGVVQHSAPGNGRSRRKAAVHLMRTPMALILVMASTALWAGALRATEPPAAAPLHPHAGAPANDARVLVQIPAPLRAHMLSNMRIHVSALNDILEALATKQEDKAAHIAEWQLGLSSLKAHQAKELGKYMPAEMRAIGWAMHSAASRFALEAQNAGVTGDLRPALAALAKVTAQCTACHAGYRVH